MQLLPYVDCEQKFIYIAQSIPLQHRPVESLLGLTFPIAMKFKFPPSHSTRLLRGPSRQPPHPYRESKMAHVHERAADLGAEETPSPQRRPEPVKDA